MPSRRRTLVLVLLLAAGFAAWYLLRPGSFEVVVLRTFTERSDSFTSLWVLDDEENDFVWLRAHRPDRRWLTQIEAERSVELRREGRTERYVARILDDDVTRRYLAEGFRRKYGLADVVRELTQGRDTVPVRLQRR